MEVRRRPPPAARVPFPPACGPADCRCRAPRAATAACCAPPLPPPERAPACVQSAFRICQNFDQPLASWDVAKVTTFRVRVRRAASACNSPPAGVRANRCDAAPRSGGVGAGRFIARAARLRRRQPCAARAAHVQRRERLQQADRLVGRPLGHKHGGASPPTARIPYPAVWCPRRSRRCPALRWRRRRRSPNSCAPPDVAATRAPRAGHVLLCRRLQPTA